MNTFKDKLSDRSIDKRRNIAAKLLENDEITPEKRAKNLGDLKRKLLIFDLLDAKRRKKEQDLDRKRRISEANNNGDYTKRMKREENQVKKRTSEELCAYNSNAKRSKFTEEIAKNEDVITKVVEDPAYNSFLFWRDSIPTLKDADSSPDDSKSYEVIFATSVILHNLRKRKRDDQQ